MNCAVIYYSRSGITKAIADKVAAAFDADMFFVEPEKAYGNYASSVIRVIGEKVGKKERLLKTPVSDFSAYDTVFIGFPVWAGTVPDFMKEYLRQADLSGKRVIPFATAGANGRESSLNAIKSLCPKSNVADYFYTSMTKRADADAWIKGLKL